MPTIKSCVSKSTKPSLKLITNLNYALEVLQLANNNCHLNQLIKELPFLTTKSWLQRINKHNLEDPLLKQILPTLKELEQTTSFTKDPLQEQQYNPIPGLLHKYKNRVLILLTSACAINCRYCFRRHFSYQHNQLTAANWQQILAYLQQRPNIQEVIFSGGDPLMLNDRLLLKYIKDLANILPINTLRLHTRIPIVLPARIKASLIKILTATRLKIVIVTHCNHPQEINAEVTTAIKKLSAANITLFNQAVLLKGINDQAATIIELSNKLFTIGILPYYLHMHDKVAGTKHFQVSITKAKKIMQLVRAELPGYLVPKLVREIPGANAKCPV